jgi:hypothetical protein
MSILRITTAALVASLFLSLLALPQEKQIKRTDLPAAVEKTVAEQSKGATIRGFSREKEKGQTFYEAELMVGGHTKDVLVDADGTIVEVEEQVALESLPKPVQAALCAKAGRGNVLKVESLTKHEKLVAYEAKVLIGGKKSEIQVGPDGSPLDHEE